MAGDRRADVCGSQTAGIAAFVKGFRGFSPNPRFLPDGHPPLYNPTARIPVPIGEYVIGYFVSSAEALHRFTMR